MNTPIEFPQPADEIRKLYIEATGLGQKWLGLAVRMGELLYEQKRSLGHGQWLRWVDENLPFCSRTAANYLRLYEERDRLKSANVSDLTAAYQLLKWNRWELHPLSSIFPWDEATVESIADDLRMGSELLFPITLYEGKILDGKLRYEACRRAGAEPHFDNYTGNDPKGFLLTRNLYRQHLGAEERAIVEEKLAELRRIYGSPSGAVSDSVDSEP